MKFPYRRYPLKEPAPGFPEGALYRPRIPIVVVGPDGEAGFEALVDTSSDQTTFPSHDLAAIGFSASRRSTTTVRGGFGDHEELLHFAPQAELLLQADGKSYRWSADIWLSSSENSAAILGHSGFLEHFIAIFNGATRELDLKPTKTFPGKATKLWV